MRRLHSCLSPLARGCFAAGLAAFVIFSPGRIDRTAAASVDPTPGVAHVPAVLISRVAPLREALVVAPGSDRLPLVASDRRAYSDLLSRLGFDVVVVTTESRPDIDAAFRDFARAVAPGADVAVLLLGAVAQGPNGLYLMPAGPAATPETIATEGLPLIDALQRIVRRRPRDAVLVADGCAASLPTCGAEIGTLPRGVSAIVTGSVSRPVSGGARFATFGRALLPEMTSSGETFDSLGSALQAKLLGSDRDVAVTSPLTTTFAFLPSGFLEALPLSCNGVDPALDAEGLRSRASVEPLVADCADAAQRYAFSAYFKSKLAVVAEQEAAQKALGDCDQSLARAYLDGYPTGRYRDAVLARQRSCIPSRPAVPANPLQTRATDAVADYFKRHDYTHGDGFGSLVQLYPPQLHDRSGNVSRADHLHRIGAWYGDYDSVQFRPGLDRLDLSGCNNVESCLIRGTVRVQSLKAGESQYAFQDAAFTLRLDLSSGQIKSECGVLDPPDTNATPCE